MWPEPLRSAVSREDLAGIREEDDLVCSSCHNKIPAGSNRGLYFLTVLEARNHRSTSDRVGFW